VSATTTVAVEFTLSNVAIQLTPVVTTATGDTRRVEIGNATTTIDASKLTETAPITSLTDLLNARAPGVLITPSTQTGSGARIRIRGSASINLSNDPIYIIDGIRMTSGNGSNLGTGDAQFGRANDINPEEIENIEIVKGPSAATLYGTDAANGVIVITTKKGRAGNAQWNVFAESGMLSDRNEYPWNYTIAGHSPGATAYRECQLSLISAGSCLLDSVRTYSPLHDPYATPLGNGYRGNAGVGVRGGTEAVRYSVQFTREQETGVYKLPDFEYAMADTMKFTLRPWSERPSFRDATSVRVNLNTALNSKLDVGINSNFTFIGQRLMPSSNATVGLGSQAFGGPGYPGNGTVATYGTPLHGYRAWTPWFINQEKLAQNVSRFIGSANINYRPTSWLQMRSDIGTDLTDRIEDDLYFRGSAAPISTTQLLGLANNTRADLRNFTANVSATATFNPRPWLSSKTTLGSQYVDFKQYSNGARGIDLPPGAQTAGDGATPRAQQSTTLQRTLGQFVEEVLAFNDRLFVTGAVRSDQNSAFGTAFQNVLYPKLSVSWILSEERWFKAPSMLHLDQLRLRYAYGKSGVQPGPNDALRSFDAATYNIRNTETPAIQFGAIGNQTLKPEQSAELETGFEARFFRGRASIDVTYYYKINKDALISAVVPPSLGSASNVRQNLGALRNDGFEMLLTTQLVDKSWLGLDATLSASINENQVLSLGGTPPQIGVPSRIVEGYPLRGYWTRHITGWSDKNKDGILTYNADPNLNEVFLAPDTTFKGYASPRQFAALTLGFDLFKRRLRLSALTDYRGGNVYYNNTERIRCVSRGNCNGWMNPKASFEEQAMVIANKVEPSQTLDGYLQPGAFIKLREVSAQYTLPASLAAGMRARTANITASVRNIAKWTKYRGVDPENDYQASDGSEIGSDFQTFGAATYFLLRVTLGF
jgi:TonB-linked SusC/RagA family outer membrane protein